MTLAWRELVRVFVAVPKSSRASRFTTAIFCPRCGLTLDALRHNASSSRLSQTPVMLWHHESVKLSVVTIFTHKADALITPTPGANAGFECLAGRLFWLARIVG